MTSDLDPTLLRESVAAHPQDPSLRNSLGYALAKQGSLAEAESCFRIALELLTNTSDAVATNQQVETLRNLALCLSQQGKHRQVLEVSQRLVSLQPNDPIRWHELGRVQRRLKHYDSAIQALRKAIELQPDFADAYHDLGLTLSDHGDTDGAKAAYRKSLELRSDFVEALNNLGVLLEGQGEFDDAIRLLRQAVELKRAPDLLNNLGVALASARHFSEAIDLYRAALAADPNYAAALNNLGNALRSTGEVEEAIRSLRMALRLRPDYAEAYNNLAIALVQCGRNREAMRYYEQAIHFRPDYPEAHMNRALDRLALGDFSAGWIEYEWRWRGKQLRPRFTDWPRWDGTSPAGKRILIHHEQGIGDTFQFIRYARELKKRGASVFAEVQKPIAQLIELCPDVTRVLVPGGVVPDFDFHAPLMSLPGLLGTTLATIPAETPYLYADPQLTLRWKEKLNSIPGFKVGIAWQGNPDYRGDRHRSIPLKYFAPLAKIAGVSLISLQKGFGTEQLASISDRFRVIELEEFDVASGPFMDTAAIMQNLDLVISSDTALPHLAGALGVPVWVALPLACDWRWLHVREDSPWYPAMRLFRQQRRDEWSDVFERIAQSLLQRVNSSRGNPMVSSELDRSIAETKWQAAVRLFGSNELERAEQLLLEGLDRDPSNAKLHHDLGVVRGKQKRPESAVASFRRSLELAPRSASTWGNLGLAYLEQDCIDEAITHLQRALTLGPNAPETFNNLGVSYMRNSQPSLAADNYQQALRLRPDYAESHLNLARALLIQGDFSQGWLEYEWRWRCAGYTLRDDERPRWGGEPLAGRTILLYAEQGLGDTLQFVRYAKQVQAFGGKVLLECQPQLTQILAGVEGVDQIISQGSAAPYYDVQSPLMSLPGLLGTTPQNVPADVPYIFVDTQLVEKWSEILSELEGFKIGIAWQGNPRFDGDQRRSMELRQLAPLAQIPNVRVVSLQKGPGTEQLADLVNGFPVVDFGPQIDTHNGPFVDTAAIMLNLDLVITTDTAIAHLAGALGVRVWLLLAKAPDFRWQLAGDTSIWYPTMRIFRQRVRGAWDQVVEQVTASIQEVAAHDFGERTRTLAEELQAEAAHEEARNRIRDGDLAAATELLRTALDACPNHAAAHLDLGVVFARQKEFELAIQHLHMAVVLAPNDPIGYSNLGLALLEAGELEEAINVLSVGIEVDPDLPILYKHLGVARLRISDPSGAAEAFQQYCRLCPDSPDGDQLLQSAVRARLKT